MQTKEIYIKVEQFLESKNTAITLVELHLINKMFFLVFFNRDSVPVTLDILWNTISICSLLL